MPTRTAIRTYSASVTGVLAMHSIRAHTQLFQSNTHPTQPPLHMHTPINSCVKAKVVTAKAQQ